MYPQHNNKLIIFKKMSLAPIVSFAVCVCVCVCVCISPFSLPSAMALGGNKDGRQPFNLGRPSLQNCAPVLFTINYSVCDKS
jgi:hypothetical protein